MDGIPNSYEEFYERYYHLVRDVVRSKISNMPNDIEDVTSEIMVKFWERDILRTYDPGFKGNKDFKAYLISATVLYTLGKAETIWAKSQRYIPVYDDPDFKGGSLSNHYSDNPTQSLEYLDTVRELRNQVMKYRDIDGTRTPMLWYFDVLVAIIEMYGELSQEAVEHFQELCPNMKSSTIRTKRFKLREFLSKENT